MVRKMEINQMEETIQSNKHEGKTSLVSPQKRSLFDLNEKTINEEDDIFTDVADAAMDQHTSNRVRQNVCSKRARLHWTPDLHLSFLHAVERLGGNRSATPKSVLQLMNEKDVSIAHIKSHLQVSRSKEKNDSKKVISRTFDKVKGRDCIPTMFYQGFRHFKVDTAAKNVHKSDHVYSPIQQLLPQQPLVSKAITPRHEEWVVNQQVVTRPNAQHEKDHGKSKNLIQIFHKMGTSSNSPLFDVRNEITGNGYVRCQQFVDEKMSPPYKIDENQGRILKVPKNVEWIGSSLEPLALQIPVTPKVFDTNYTMKLFGKQLQPNNGFEPIAEPPFRYELLSLLAEQPKTLIREMPRKDENTTMEKESNNLQPTSTLYRSYSFQKQTQLCEGHKDAIGTETRSLKSTRSKATRRLSSLDLNLSI